MRLNVMKGGEMANLFLPTTEKEKGQTEGTKQRLEQVSTNGLHYWYPYNLNYSHVYSKSRKIIYLAKETGIETDTDPYNITGIDSSTPLIRVNRGFYHKDIYRRNIEVINYADELGIVSPFSNFSWDKLEKSFYILSDEIEATKKCAWEKYTEMHGIEAFSLNPDKREQATLDNLTKFQKEHLVALGEIYTMLNTIRKVESKR